MITQLAGGGRQRWYAAAVLLNGLDHVVVGVRDLEAAAATYSALLGREPSWRGEHAQLGTGNALFRLRNTYLELLAPTGEGEFARDLEARIERDGEGLLALAFATDDADACAAALRERGLPAADPIDGEGRDTSSGVVRRWRNVLLPERATRGLFLFAIEHRSPAEALPLAEPIGDEQAAASGIDHVVVRSSEPDACRDLYAERLGIRLALDRSFEERGVRLMFFRIGGVTLEVAAPLGPAVDPDARDRLWGLAYWIPDVAAGRKRVADAGFDVSDVRPGNKPGTRVCTVRDQPHGVATLLIGPD